MPDIDPIAAQMREARLRRGWSLPAAGVKTGLGHMTIGSYERGDRKPPLQKLRQWVEGFGLRLLVVGAADDPSRVGLNGKVWLEHAVRYGDDETAQFVCDSAEEAAAIAARMPGARVFSRRVQATGWREENGHG